MTQKELAYVEDAIGHENNIKKILEEEINNIDDEDLAEFLGSEINIHQEMESQLMELLEEEYNE